MGFIDQMRAEGHAVESIIRVLREQGVKAAARTYRAWRQGRVSARTVTDALVIDAVRDAAWRVEELPDGTTRRRMTPEGLYGRKKMTALIRRTTIADASRGGVDRPVYYKDKQGKSRVRVEVSAGELQRRAFVKRQRAAKAKFVATQKAWRTKQKRTTWRPAGTSTERIEHQSASTEHWITPGTPVPSDPSTPWQRARYSRSGGNRTDHHPGLPSHRLCRLRHSRGAGRGRRRQRRLYAWPRWTGSGHTRFDKDERYQCIEIWRRKCKTSIQAWIHVPSES